VTALGQLPKGSSENVAEEAAQWLLRLRSGAMNEAEKAHFQVWHADEANAEAFSRASRVWSAISEVSTNPKILQERNRIIAKVNRRQTFRATIVAASVALLTIGGGIALISNVDLVSTEIRTAFGGSPWPSGGRFETTIGQRSAITLSDGSVLTLNTDSAATVAFDDAERKIILTRGQAMFDVAKHQPRPFVVYAGDQRIVATGTAFDVRLNKAAVEVTLVEGHLVVERASSTRTQPMHRNSVLSAGERLVATAGETVSVSSADVERITAWTEGKLVFLDTRLDDAIAESNRYTRNSVILADKSLADLRISGVFRAGQPAEFARAVAEIYPVAVEYRPDGEIRLSHRAN
jgi:transmembrane sensor